MKRNTRNEIIESAISLMAENPLDRPSLADIVAEVGISKAAVYRHFKSKQDLDDEIEKILKSEVQHIIDVAEANPDDLAPIMKAMTQLIGSNTNHMRVLSMSILRNAYYRSRLNQLFSGKGYKEDTTSSIFFATLFGTHVDNLVNQKKEIRESDIDKMVTHVLTCLDNGVLDMPTVSTARLRHIYRECIPAREDIKDDKYLIALSNILVKYGTSSITIKNIAAELGQAESTLYSKFTTKEEMLAYTAKKEMKNLIIPLNATLERYEKDEEKIFAMYAYIVNYISLSPELSGFVLLLSLDQSLGNRHRVKHEAIFSEFIENIPIKGIYLKHDSDIAHLKFWCFGCAVVLSFMMKNFALKDREDNVIALNSYLRNGIHIDDKENI
ncbi:MAG: TetR/AcrR family transcriptional regulator [Spirochaetales bacterium]|nr:TetR/AcrR family transcriptional regulator [Spirochaetales bacterium]